MVIEYQVFLLGQPEPVDIEDYMDHILNQTAEDHLSQQESYWLPDYLSFHPGCGSRSVSTVISQRPLVGQQKRADQASLG